MNEDDSRKEELPAEDDLNTTPPNPPAPAAPPKWEMPKPVFQQSSGYLPKGYAEQFAPTAEKSESESPPVNSEPAGEGNPTSETAAPALDVPASKGVEPQPEIFEPLPEANSVEPSAATPKKKRGLLRIAFIIFGLLAAGFVLIFFLAVVWYFFLSSNGSRGPF